MKFDKDSLLKRKYELLEKNRELRSLIAGYPDNFFTAQRAEILSNDKEIASIDHDLELLYKDNK